MADSTPNAASAGSFRSRMMSRTTLPYLVAAVLASTVMAWYFFVFVPSQLDYFVGLRFRTLAVAGAQVKSKAENLARSLTTAVRPVGPGSVRSLQGDDLREYFSALVPEIILADAPTEGRPRGAGLHLATAAPPDKSGAAPMIRATVPWPDVVRPAASVSRRDFDDLVLADANGVVLWQRETTTPRIGNLDELLVTDSEPQGWFSLNWRVRTSIPKAQGNPPLPTTAFLRTVDLAGSSSYLLIQSIGLSPDGIENAAFGVRPRYFLAGLVSEHALQQQAMRIPIVWIVFVALPVVLLFLALPFVKLATLTSKERYGFADAILLGVAAIFAVGIGAILPFGPAAIDAKADSTLEEFAHRIEDGFALETASVLRLARTIGDDYEGIRDHLAPCQPVGRETDRCDLWEALPEPSAPTGAEPSYRSLDLDVVAWVDRDGWQIRKWTTKRAVTGPVSHAAFTHFQDLIAHHTWQLKNPDNGPLPRFTIEPLRTPTTSEMGFVFAIPLTDLPVPADVASAEMFILNVRPQSVVDPVVPPGYGFAVIGEDGNVLFHSEEALSLEENFFAEVSDPAGVRAKAASGHHVTWSGDYHGRPHRFHMQPMSEFAGCPWRIVTFQEMEPMLGALFRQQAGILRLGMLNILILAGLLFAFWLYSRSTHRKVRDALLSPGSINPEGVRALAGVAGFALIVLALTYYSVVDQSLDAIYLIFAVLPILTIVTAIVTRERRSVANEDAQDRLRVMQLSLLLFLISVAPAIGFARVVYRVQDIRNTERWLEGASQEWTARRGRVLDRVNRSGYSAGTRTFLLAEGFAVNWPVTASTTPGTCAEGGALPPPQPPIYSYLDVVDRACLDAQVTGQSGAQEPVDLKSGQTLLRAILNWTIQEPTDSPPTPAVKAYRDDHLYRLVPVARTNLPSFNAAFTRGFAGDVSWFPAILGFAIVAGTGGALWWARKRLNVPRFVPSPSLALQIASVSLESSDAVLLIGPPRARKDQAVHEALLPLRLRADGTEESDTPERRPAPPGLRFPLLDATIDDAFLKTAMEKVDAVKAGSDLLDLHGRLWIHLSNLEAQLTTAAERTRVLQLFDRLFLRLAGQPPRILIVTTSVDPIANFAEVFGDERHSVGEEAIPEVELSRSSLLLSRFRRCYLPIDNQDGAERWQHWLGYDETKWRETLALEVNGYEPLVPIARELEERGWKDWTAVPAEALARVVAQKAEATYELLWTSCTRSEKLVLVQLAQEGLVNPKSRDVAARLMAKGFIIDRPGPTIFNYTFREFLRRIERSRLVNRWEQLEGAGLWVTAGRLVGSSLIAGGIFFLLTQDFSVQALLPIISGTGVFGIPVVRDLFARFTGKGGASG